MRHVLRYLAPLGGARRRWFLEGMLAAGLGLAAIAVLVLLLWTLSSHPDSGVGGALRLAADLWLLAHGADLTRAATDGGPPAPVGVTPLLLTVLPLWLLRRAVGVCDWSPQPGQGALAALWISCGYLAVAAAVVPHTAPAALSADPLSALAHLPLFALAVTLAAAFAISGPPLAAPADGTGPFDGRRLVAAGRIALTGLGACCAAGALLFLLGFAQGAHRAQDALGQLGPDWAGRLAVLCLAVALLPNAVVWATAWGLGPGFTLGAGSAVTPAAVTGTAPDLPPFPLLAALPAGAAWPWAAALVPVAAATSVAWATARAAVPDRGRRATAAGWGGTVLTVLLAGCGAGAALGLLAALAGGPLGTGALAAFGPDPVPTALAAAVWTAVPAVPLALALRLWRLRRTRWARAGAGRAVARAARLRPTRRREAAPTGARRRFALRRGRRGRAPSDGWHTTGARRTRWAALKKSSGTLVPELPDPGDPAGRPGASRPAATDEPAPRP
ncbi:cell division protein PerM [Streptomyces marincola]|uniref:cell division protein PerM n=1 Tax=Streptomyces marincola TaxID=2878388 RepID=UPI001CF1E559|nr:DUF6350 family protein [Streptomyces marincola]UCM89954.1 DUF6350 family protein [Streptomyces marincola]